MLDNSGSMSIQLPQRAGLLYPVDVQTDSSGNIFVLEYAWDRMKIFDSSGNYVRGFGSRGNSCKQWRHARQFVIHNDLIYIADYGNRRVTVLDLNGNCVRSRATVFSLPSGIAVNDDYVFVSNTGSSIEKFTRSNLNQAGYQNFGSGEVYWPFGMSMNNAGNKLILANWHGRRFTEFNVAGSTLNFSRSLYRGRQGFDADYDSNGNIFGAEAHRLRKYNSSLTYQNQIASNYNMPLGVHLDSSDNIFVADHRKNRLVKYNNAGAQQFQVGGGRAKTRLRAARDLSLIHI